MTRWQRGRPSLRETLAMNEAALKAMSPTGELEPRMQRVFDENRPAPKRVLRKPKRGA